jgi:hypothetical protein
MTYYQIHNGLTPWIRGRIEANADPQHRLSRYRVAKF